MNYIDLDFFQPERDRVAEKRKKLIPLLIIGIVIIVLVLLWIILRLYETKLDTQLTTLKEEVTTEQSNTQILQQRLDSANAEIAAYENGQSTFDPFGMEINEINADHLRSIMASTPNEAFYKDIVFKNNVLTLDGYTKNTQVVAKIANNLESTNSFDAVIISNIVKDDDGGYTFTINASVKE